MDCTILWRFQTKWLQFPQNLNSADCWRKLQLSHSSRLLSTNRSTPSGIAPQTRIPTGGIGDLRHLFPDGDALLGRKNCWLADYMVILVECTILRFLGCVSPLIQSNVSSFGFFEILMTLYVVDAT